MISSKAISKWGVLNILQFFGYSAFDLPCCCNLIEDEWMLALGLEDLSRALS
jgi:hypothetical protein